MTEPKPDAPKMKKSVDLTAAYESAANHIVPRSFFPIFAAFFVILCGGMAVILFGVGKIFGGALFSCPVLAGLYVAWNNAKARWRTTAASRMD